MKPRFPSSVILFAAGIVSACVWNPRVARAAATYVPFNGEKTTWHDGFDRYDYLMDEASFAIAPCKRPDTEKFVVGNPPKVQRRFSAPAEHIGDRESLSRVARPDHGDDQGRPRASPAQSEKPQAHRGLD